MKKAEPILLVEDSVEDFEATSRAFKKAELSNPLEHVSSGEKAIEHLRTSQRPCLILLDLNMPGMGGIRFLELIKQDANLREIPVVILTTSNYEPDIKASYARGANAYVLKSGDFNVLATNIKRLKEYWLDTVVLPAIFDEETSNGKNAFSIENGEGPNVYLSPNEVKQKVIGQKPQKALDDKSKLTPQEIETLTWIARGKSRWEAGVILGVTEDTVKARLEKCRQKLDASNTTHAIAIALMHNLLHY